MTVWTSDLFLHHNIELFAEIEVFEFQKDFDFEFRTFHRINVHFVVKIRIVHFLFSHSVVEILSARVIKSLIS